MNTFPHRSVLLNECMDAFKEIELISFVDGTLGAGGHSEAILSSHKENQVFLGIDQDTSALKIAKERLSPLKSKSLILEHGNFSDLEHLLKKNHLKEISGILVDLGVSSMQLDQAERGFSFMREGPLDMRMNDQENLTAKDIINTYEEKKLADLFFRYGEEKDSRRAAKAIVEYRKTKPLETTKELADLIEKSIRRRKWEIHPATQIFQALRIAVNKELDRLESFLHQAIKALKKGGRLAVITFHSLEDRMVKHCFAYYASDKESTSGIGGVFLMKTPTIKILTRKPIGPSLEEIKSNPRSRSAKLRIIEKL